MRSLTHLLVSLGMNEREKLAQKANNLRASNDAEQAARQRGNYEYEQTRSKLVHYLRESLHTLMRLLKLLLIVFVCAAGPAVAGPFEDGEAAFSKGDYATALSLFRPLAAQGHVEAQLNLGFMYETGHGVPQDYAAALSLWRPLAAQGNARAQFFLGYMYETGRGVPQDYKEAARWYGLAATLSAAARHSLGEMYERGQGVPQDNVRAHMWYSFNANDNSRKRTATKMTSAQIEQAQEMAQRCQASNFKNCD
jgi:TPR repeat protein